MFNYSSIWVNFDMQIGSFEEEVSIKVVTYYSVLYILGLPEHNLLHKRDVTWFAVSFETGVNNGTNLLTETF